MSLSRDNIEPFIDLHIVPRQRLANLLTKKTQNETAYPILFPSLLLLRPLYTPSSHSVSMHKTQRKLTTKKSTTTKPAATKKKAPVKAVRRTLATKRVAAAPFPTLQLTAPTPVLTIPRATITTSPSLPNAQRNVFKTLAAIPHLNTANLFTLSLRRFQTGNERLNGTVKWFDSAKGFGFISNNETGTDLFVHFTSINTNGYRSLNEGQAVEYSIGSTAKGPAAVDVVPTEQQNRDAV